jgi:hypothetical protein
MRYLAIYKAEETGAPPSAEHIAKMGALIDEMTKAGVLLSTEGCLPSSRGFRARRKKGKVIVTDGPFTETKEIIGGFALLEVQSREEAVRWTERFLEVAGDGESEVRLLNEPQGLG